MTLRTISFLSVIAYSLVAASSGARASAPTIDPRLIHKTAFEQNWDRYPAPDEIIRTFNVKFPLALQQNVPESCRLLNMDNRGVLGDNEPATGVPSVSRPNSSFVNWYATCLVAYIKAESTDAVNSFYMVYKRDGSAEVKNRTITVKDFENQYTAEVVKECRSNGEISSSFDTNPSLSSFTCRWKTLSPASKTKLVQSFVRAAIGPEDVIIDLGIAPSEGALLQRFLDEIDRFEKTPDHRYDFLGQPPSELSVVYTSMMLKFLINIEDTLRY